MMEEIDSDISDCDLGMRTYLGVYADLHDIEKYASQKKAEIKGECIEQAYEGSEANGYEFEIRTGRKMFDFSELEDWKAINEAKKELESKYKQAFQAHQSGNMLVDEHGEVTGLPDVKYADDSLILKPKK